MKLCRWKCGQSPKNLSMICDDCWYASLDRAKSTPAIPAKPRRSMSDSTKAALKAARLAKTAQ